MTRGRCRLVVIREVLLRIPLPGDHIGLLETSCAVSNRCMICGMEGHREGAHSGTVAPVAEPHACPRATRGPRVSGEPDAIVARAEEVLDWLATTTGAGVEDAVRIDRIAALERVKGALAAAQVRQTVAFAESQRAGLPAWTPERTVARSIGSQVALARRESPTRGDAHVELALALSRSMPETLAALTAGRISEAAAEGVHRALEGMDPTLRAQVDDRLAPELGTLGERSLAEAARREANAVDEGAATRRAEKAVGSRRVTLRTAKDGMAYFTLLAPMAEAAGAFRAVEAEAAALLGEPCLGGAASRRGAFWLADPPAASTGADTGQPAVLHGGPADARDLSGAPGRSPTSAPAPAADPDESQPARSETFLRPAVERSTGSQLMADIVIARLTGRSIGQPVPIEIQLVMTDLAMEGQAADHGDDPRGDAGSRRGPTRDAGASPTPSAPEFRRGGGGASGACSRRAQPAGSSGHPVTPSSPAGDSRPGEHAPAKVVGAGWLPAGFARELVRRTAAAGSGVTVRRVMTGDDGTTVVGIEGRRRPWKETAQSRTREPLPVLAPTSSVQRLFRGVLRRLVVVRDQSCRTPFCAAAIRAADHVTPVRRDGPTCAHNAGGMCARCNVTKEAPGWEFVVRSPASRAPTHRVEPDTSEPPWQQLMDSLLADDREAEVPDSGHRTAVITPTGHQYESAAPPVTSSAPKIGGPGSHREGEVRPVPPSPDAEGFDDRP